MIADSVSIMRLDEILPHLKDNRQKTDRERIEQLEIAVQAIKRRLAIEAKMATGWRPGMKNSEIPEPEEHDRGGDPMFEPEPDEGNA